MQELNDEQMNEVSGGGWGAQQQIDFSKTKKTTHYFYPEASVRVSGGQISLKPGASRQKITTAWGVKKVKIDSGSYTYKTSKGQSESMIHINITGIGKGYIHAGFKNYIVTGNQLGGTIKRKTNKLK